MSGSTPQTGVTQQQTGGQTGSPLQQQLFQIGKRQEVGSISCSLMSLYSCNYVLKSCALSPAAALHSRASQSARQTAAALLQYCSTGDARVLLAIQRHLCGVQDGNGDT